MSKSGSGGGGEGGLIGDVCAFLRVIGEGGPVSFFWDLGNNVPCLWVLKGFLLRIWCEKFFLSYFLLRAFFGSVSDWALGGCLGSFVPGSVFACVGFRQSCFFGWEGVGSEGFG